jgi:structure-specific recognition protein 1
MADEQTFGSISLFAGGISSQGALRLGADKVEWKKAGGGRSVSIAKGDVGEVTYSQIPGGVSLTVRSKGSAPAMRMKGFRGSDITAVKEAMKSMYGAECTKRDMQSIGRNWGQVQVDQAGAITFDVENKRAFEISAKDVSGVQMPSKHEVMVEFHMDDAVMNASKDAMVEMSFYVPPSNKTWGVEGWGEDDHDPDDTGAKRLSDRLMEICAVDTATGDAIAEFDSVSLVAPRGKVGIELYANHLRLNGNAVDFKIQHSSIQRLFLLPKPTNAQTYAILHLDPPIRKGQTFYPHIVAVFNANEELEVEPLLDANLKGEVWRQAGGIVRRSVLRGVHQAPQGGRGCQAHAPGYVQRRRGRARRQGEQQSRSRPPLPAGEILLLPAQAAHAAAVRGGERYRVRAARGNRTDDAAHVRHGHQHAQRRDAPVPLHPQG